MILAVTVYRDPPKAVLIETGGRLLLTCKSVFLSLRLWCFFSVELLGKKSLQGIAAPLGFDGLLVFLCTLYAVSNFELFIIDIKFYNIQIKTRNLPENFNGKLYQLKIIILLFLLLFL